MSEPKTIVFGEAWPKPQVKDHAWRIVQRIDQRTPVGLMEFDDHPVEIYDVSGLTEVGICWGTGANMLPWYRP